MHIRNGFLMSHVSPAQNGWELNGTYIAAALALAFGGFGAYSLDSALGLSALSSGHAASLTMGLAIVLTMGNLLVRRHTPAAQPTT